MNHIIFNFIHVMKNRFLTLLSAGIIALGGVLTSCQPKETPATAAVEAVNAEVLSAEVTLNVSKLIEYAYIISDSEIEITDPAVIFATGTTGTLIEGTNSIFFTGLEGSKTYYGIVAFKKSADEFFDITLPFSFTTGNYTETYTLIDTYSDGFKLHFKVPQSVKDAGNAIRFNVGSLPMYLNAKLGWFAQLERDMLLQNGQQHFVNDTTLCYTSDNIYAKDANGEFILDEWSGEPFMLHTPFSPGEPIIFTAGEFSWDDTDFTGWGSGYYNALFDLDAYYESQGGGWAPWSFDIDDTELDEDKYWTGYYMRRRFILDQPSVLDAELKIEKEIGATRGTITITPDDNILQYCVLILPDAEYLDMLPYIDNNTDYLQWFTASYPAALLWSAMTCTGPTQLILEDMYYLEPETQYHLLITALGDEKGMSQKFYHEVFSTTAKTHPAPVMEVTPIDNPSGEESPYEVWFNVKCTSKDAVSAKYAANYEREFGMAFNGGATYNSLVEIGNAFSVEEMDLINSDEGRNISFSTMPGQTTVLAVLGYNDEDTPNTIEGTDYSDPAVAKKKAIDEPAKAPVESSLFKDLLGDWTMSADVAEYDYYSSAWVPAGTKSCKISIVEGVSYPETLDESVYATYKDLVGMSKEEVDALYDEFKTEMNEFNAMLKGQNRLLCYGFGFDNADTQYFTLNTPYDLFTSKSYTGYDNNSTLWDCGPKWYLEILEDGSVVAPVNAVRQYPLNLAGYYTVYLAGVADKYINVLEDGSDVLFPVSVSDDANTVTVNPYIHEDTEYFLNGMYSNYGYMYPTNNKITSALTLTKGWTEEGTAPASVKSAGNAAPQMISIPSVNGMKEARISPAKRKTSFKAMVKYNKVTVQPSNFEEASKNLSRKYAARK